jgi:AcrR family transcriptional regulator
MASAKKKPSRDRVPGSRALPGKKLPVADPVTELSPTARRILVATRKVLARKGFSGLTFDAISAESGENRALIRYHFGSKAGLVAALVEWLDHEDSATLVRTLSGDQTTIDRPGALLRMQREGCKASRPTEPFFDLVPHILRDKAMRARFAELYRWYREYDGWVLAPDAEGEAKAEAERLGTLAIAVYDGLALQRASDPSLDIDALYETWERLLKGALDELGGAAASPSNDGD